MTAVRHTIKTMEQFAKPAENPYTKTVTGFVQIASSAKYIILKMFQDINIKVALKLPYKT